MTLIETAPIWVPHKPETWSWRLGRLKADTTFYNHRQANDATWLTEERMVPAGTLVKIVMVSRLGDVGVTDDLTKDYGGYNARVLLEDLIEEVSHDSAL